MKKLFLIIIFISFLSSGCIDAEKISFKLNSKTGEFQRIYHNLSTDKDGEEMQEEWEELKKTEQKMKEQYDPDVIETLKTELFQEDNILSGKVEYKIKGPKCFPSKAIMLTFLHDEDWRIEIINDEIFVIMPSDIKVVNSNGQVLNTQNNSIIVWPVEQEVFEYQIKYKEFEGNSLLPYFLKENQNQSN